MHLDVCWQEKFDVSACQLRERTNLPFFCLFVLSRPSRDQMISSYIVEGNLLHNSFYLEFCFGWYGYCYFCYLFVCIIWFYLSLSFVYNLSKSSCFRFVSCKQHIVECCFLLQSESLCLLIGEFSTFTYIVVTDLFGLISVIFHYRFYFLCFIAIFYVSSLDIWTIFCLLLSFEEIKKRELLF